MQKVFFNFLLAVDGVLDNRLRAILTALGVMFGVGAVIAMLAIGAGAKQDILERMRLIGTNNIEIKAKMTFNDENSDDDPAIKSSTRPYSPGLTLSDAMSIQKILPTVEKISPELVLNETVVREGLMGTANCVGVTNDFFVLNNLQLEQGNFFHYKQAETGQSVCIIGNSIKAKFFSKENPIGKKIRCRNTWLTVIGVIGKRIANKKSLENLGIRDYNSDIYIPIQTALLRYEDRALSAEVDPYDDEENNLEENYHQIDRLVVRVNESSDLLPSSEVVGRMLNRRHRNVRDYEIVVPELLLEQEQKTQDTFNTVLAVIAFISLLVGGIGIMNIMLASVLERIKEIGVRRSLGATKQDIILQFLFESIFMSLIGGVFGILLGVVAADMIASNAEIPTVISTWSIVLSFGVAASIGLIFGIVPAVRAANADPIKALRSD